MTQAAEPLRDFLRRRVYPGRYAPDLKSRTKILAHRLDHGEFPVIYTTVGRQYPLGAANFVGKALENRPALFLLFFTWASHTPYEVSRSVKALSVYRDRRPQHRFVFLCNTERERAAHASAGLDAVLCNDNAFVDEGVFTPGDATAAFDAVYNAAMVDWKRHELSRLVSSCVQVTYKRSDVTEEATTARLAELRRIMPTHSFANTIRGGGIELLPPEIVANVLRQVRCGLCLSEVEGAMWASIEYLLAGLPVVSTPSLGGRDEFADPDYWLTVEASAEAVAAGVREMVGRNLCRADIRARTLARVYEHRARLRAIVAEGTAGQVELPPGLGDRAYRFITGLASRWPMTPDLPAVLAIRPEAA